jgi:hypothetical protein
MLHRGTRGKTIEKRWKKARGEEGGKGGLGYSTNI